MNINSQIFNNPFTKRTIIKDSKQSIATNLEIYNNNFFLFCPSRSQNIDGHPGFCSCSPHFELCHLPLLCSQFSQPQVLISLLSCLACWEYTGNSHQFLCVLPSDAADFLRVQFQGTPIQMGRHKG